jgi:hypothetical protein
MKFLLNKHYILNVKNDDFLGIIPVLMLTVLNLKIYRSISAATAAHNILSSAHRYLTLPACTRCEKFPG